MTDVVEQARAWIADDPDTATREELQQLIVQATDGDEEAKTDLEDRFSGFLQFGTAGLRGALGAGPNRMNRAVVIQTAAGLTAFLKASRQPAGGGIRHRVVVGYDARHGSYQFATDTAAVMTAAGFDVYLMPRLLPTPVTAFAVRYLHADAGVMVTASHNPPQDNGYKVYLGGPDEGAQIIPPTDSEISSFINAVAAVSEVPRAEDGWSFVGEDVIEAYIASAAALASADNPRDLTMVVTSLHGVGGVTIRDVLTRAGFADIHSVTDQHEPDPDFPTVAFPNPEETGALDRAITLAREVGADLVLANDPDADRCAVAVPNESTEWSMLRGDEVGAIIGEHLASTGATGVFASSIVSSRLLGQIAARYDRAHVETLTGFKWISRVPGLRYGYEEALGYCVDPASVRDKDGISAAVVIADIAAQAKADGHTLRDLLDELATTYGLYTTDQLSFRTDDLSQISAAMQTLREHPPKRLGDSTVVSVEDLSGGTDSLPPTDGMRYFTADDSRIIVRPSGTEPKLKCYFEVVTPVTQSVPIARTHARERLRLLRQDIEALLGLER